MDTSVVIEFHEQGVTLERDRRLTSTPWLSIFSWIELEGGVHALPELADRRRRRLDVLLGIVPIVPFDTRVISAYGRIVSALGFSRRQILDRLIAATAIVHDLTLATLNDADFRTIPDFRLEVWPAQ